MGFTNSCAYLCFLVTSLLLLVLALFCYDIDGFKYADGNGRECSRLLLLLG